MSLQLKACDHVKMIDEMKATNLDTGEHGESFMTAVLTQLKRTVASTQQVNRRHFTEPTVLLKWSTVLKFM